jgi:sugar lactone lactonase YvrE
VRRTSLFHRALTTTAGLVAAATLAACGTAAAPEEVLPEEDSALDLPIALRPAESGLRSVMWVGNNWEGTASIVDARTLEVLKRGVNLVPDKTEETQRILRSPVATVFYLAINAGPGQGHNQYVDDMFTTVDGKYLAVSRPSFADVVWIDIAKATAGRTDSIVREQQMDGYRTDHMQVSNDGSRLLVSDSTARQVIEYSMVDETLPDGTKVRIGDRLRTFASGETPHESNYTEDGERILHASIGRVYTPADDLDPADGSLLGLPLNKLGLSLLGLDRLLDRLPWSALEGAVKSDRWLQYVDADTFEVLERWNIGKELAEAGHPGMSSAVRPVAVHPNGRLLYLQVSFLHGYVVFDTEAADLNGTADYTLGGEPEPSTGAVVDVVELENRVPSMMLEAYVNDSAHHGIAISGDGETLCVAGTMDDYAALVDVATGETTYFDEETTGHGYGKPYWSTEGLDETCWVSLSDDDAVAVLSTRTGEELAHLPVGNHPQRVRHGYVPEAVVATW